MSIQPVSSSLPPVVQALQAAKAAPFKRDPHGDLDSNSIEAKRSEGIDSSKGGGVLNIKA